MGRWGRQAGWAVSCPPPGSQMERTSALQGVGGVTCPQMQPRVSGFRHNTKGEGCDSPLAWPMAGPQNCRARGTHFQVEAAAPGAPKGCPTESPPRPWDCADSRRGTLLAPAPPGAWLRLLRPNPDGTEGPHPAMESLQRPPTRGLHVGGLAPSRPTGEGQQGWELAAVVDTHGVGGTAVPQVLEDGVGGDDAAVHGGHAPLAVWEAGSQHQQPQRGQQVAQRLQGRRHAGGGRVGVPSASLWISAHRVAPGVSCRAASPPGWSKQAGQKSTPSPASSPPREGGGGSPGSDQRMLPRRGPPFPTGTKGKRLTDSAFGGPGIGQCLWMLEARFKGPGSGTRRVRKWVVYGEPSPSPTPPPLGGLHPCTPESPLNWEFATKASDQGLEGWRPSWLHPTSHSFLALPSGQVTDRFGVGRLLVTSVALLVGWTSSPARTGKHLSPIGTVPWGLASFSEPAQLGCNSGLRGQRPQGPPAPGSSCWGAPPHTPGLAEE